MRRQPQCRVARALLLGFAQQEEAAALLRCEEQSSAATGGRWWCCCSRGSCSRSESRKPRAGSPRQEPCRLGVQGAEVGPMSSVWLLPDYQWFTALLFPPRSAMNKARSKAHTTHFNRCNRDRERWQKIINTKGPMTSNSLCTDGQARDSEDIVFKGKPRGLIPSPSSKALAQWVA